MDLHIKRIKETPYKLVFNGPDVVGMFDHNTYIARENMNDKQRHIVNQYHADSFPERFDELSNKDLRDGGY